MLNFILIILQFKRLLIVIVLFVVLLNVVLKACIMPIPRPSLPLISFLKQRPLSPIKS